ncbi:PilZ domain-containing protein [Desulfovibrio ferrophilus]|uniref:PilZ domain-containing protein n=1 Tax=Desulfovibrio ferrophilus TaxID=241368 RepID=A0A2Z6AYW1_9BACT|nr:PilZ domain-containing protein [Desulfovibrio ferrophilus]BBD08380.1 uncharacterized protein DFE_1654 [Desulfovibrio ferrophilus]
MGHSELYEQRHFNARMRLTAFAFNHVSEIVSGASRRPISLVNIHHQGARLRMQPGVNYDLSLGHTVTLNLNLGGTETENLTGHVTWTSDDDIYVDFGSPLTVGASYLQGLIDN